MEANLRPIPPPHDEDNEDVHWALSTATALWGRGEREEALRWLRRAAEQASDANADLRALELFKAAAEVAQKISGSEADPGAAASPDAASAPASAPPSAPGPPAAGASAPPPKPGAPGPGALPSRPPAAGADWTERGGAGASSPSPSPSGVKRAPSVRAPAGNPPPAPTASAAGASRDAGAPRPAAGLGRPAPVSPERTPAPAPVKPAGAATRTPTPTQQSPAARSPGAAPAIPARAAAASPGAAPAGAGPTGSTPGRPVPAQARSITSFAASNHTRVSSTTAVTEEVPAVKLPAGGALVGRGPGRGGGALKSTTEEQHAADGEPPADQRETVPTNIAFTSGRLHGSPLVGASSSQEATERSQRPWPESDDEGTTRRPLTAQEQRVLMEHRIEDLDEETPMLGLEQMAGDGEPSGDAPLGAPEEANASDDRGGWTEAEPDDDEGTRSAPAAQQRDAALTRERSAQGAEGAVSWARAPAADDRGSAAVDSSWSDPPYEGEWQAPPPRLPASQIEPLPALRVAVIGISSTGELRLVPMDGRNAPPRGAALGILVPLSPGDGETIARLLQLRG
ncbi:hypothetical protein [Sorangium sp. So ce388]|uniref:hypothetical protein n=1 Tax=Sorangium sp. So ce388 TaxID=3133309 RepID=UPI003F5C7A82